MNQKENPIKLYKNNIQNVAPLWDKCESCALWYDTSKKAWVASDYRKTYRELYGTLWPLRAPSWTEKKNNLLRLLGRGLTSKRWKESSVILPIPSDAVIIQARHGLVIASSNQRRVLKMVSGQTKNIELQNEKRGVRSAERAGLGNMVPEIVAEGEGDGEVTWLFMEMALNTNPVCQPFHY